MSAPKKLLMVDVMVRARGLNDTVEARADGLTAGEIAEWLDRAIIALGAERRALANCGIHGAPERWEERSDADEVELLANLRDLSRTARGKTRQIIQDALSAFGHDVEARMLIRRAARLIETRDDAGRAALEQGGQS